MAAFPLPATWASCQPPFGVVPRQRHTTWNSHSPVTTTFWTCELSEKEFCGLTTQYRANFLQVYLLGRLGGSVVSTDEPPNRQAIKLYTFRVV